MPHPACVVTVLQTLIKVKTVRCEKTEKACFLSKKQNFRTLKSSSYYATIATSFYFLITQIQTNVFKFEIINFFNNKNFFIFIK